MLSAPRVVPPTKMRVFVAGCLIVATVLSLEQGTYKFVSRFGENKIRYTKALADASNIGKAERKLSYPPVVCVHGFGGNADQFRKNMPVLAENGYDCYAIDLMGYGFSDKPNPKDYEVNEVYNFENWALQLTDFVKDVVKEPVVLVTNSVGGCVGLQAAAYTEPDLIRGIALICVSLRLLHVKKQSPIIKPFVKILQNVLRETPLGKSFFSQIAQPRPLKNILNEAYNAAKGGAPVDDETVDIILQPGLDPRAADVFLDFISYSGGPLPEELLPVISDRPPEKRIPVRFLWGEIDPWEPIELGRATYADFPCVDEFVTLPKGGHCPMDQIPDTVNKEILRFLTDNFK